eukprot:2212554-Amphidinium_carterae.3
MTHCGSSAWQRSNEARKPTKWIHVQMDCAHFGRAAQVLSNAGREVWNLHLYKDLPVVRVSCAGCGCIRPVCGLSGCSIM